MALDIKPARNDFTSREFAKLIGALLGGLCELGSIDDVKKAVDWWSNNTSAWDTFRKMKAYYTENPDLDVMVTFKPNPTDE